VGVPKKPGSAGHYLALTRFAAALLLPRRQRPGDPRRGVHL